MNTPGTSFSPQPNQMPHLATSLSWNLASLVEQAFYSGPESAHIPLTLPTLLPIGRGRKRKRDSSALFWFSFLKETFSKVLSLISIPVLSLKYFDLLYLSRDLCSGSESPSADFSRCWWVILNSWRSLGGRVILVIKKLNVVQLKT